MQAPGWSEVRPQALFFLPGHSTRAVGTFSFSRRDLTFLPQRGDVAATRKKGRGDVAALW